MKVFVAIFLALTVAARGVDSVDSPSMFSKMVSNCLASNETMTCLSIKGITALNRAARIAKLEILPGVSIRRDSMISARSARAISENEIRDSLPAEETERSGSLFDLAMESMANFFGSHSLIVKFPTENSFFARAIKELRHKKKKKHWMPQLALALAIKALILAKLALLSKFCKGGGGHHAGLVKLVDNSGGAAAQTDINAGTGFAEQYPYSRTYDRAQNLAYNAYYTE